MEKFLLSVMKGENRFMLFGFLIHAFVSGFFTFRGLSLDAEGFLETAAFSVFAIAAGVLIFLFWHFALLVVPTFKKLNQILMGWFTVFFGTFLIIWSSCMPNYTAAAGRSAKEHHVRHYITSVEAFLDGQYSNAMTIDGMTNILDGHHDRYDGFAEREYSKGTFSGSSGGSGAVHLSLLSVRDRIGSMADLSRTHVRIANEQYDIASKSIAEMRRIVLLDKDLSERGRLIAIESNKTYQALSKMNPETLAVSLRRTAEILPDELVVPRTLSRNPEIAQKQAEAIARLKDDIKRTAKSIAEPAAEIIAASDIALERFEPMSASKTARVYWQEYTPHMIAAFAIDLFPLCILLFLTATMGVRSEQEIAVIEFKSMTLEEIYRASLAKDILRNPALSPRGMGVITDAMIGDLNDGDQS